MFLEKTYVLGNEIAEKMGINIANISMLSKELENKGNLDDTIKLGNCTFINKESNYLPNNIKKALNNFEFECMSDKLPCRFVHQEFGISKAKLIASGIVEKTIQISGKKFYVFDKEFILKTKGKVFYVLNEEETEICIEQNQIDGFVKLSNNKYLTWY